MCSCKFNPNLFELRGPNHILALSSRTKKLKPEKPGLSRPRKVLPPRLFASSDGQGHQDDGPGVGASHVIEVHASDCQRAGLGGWVGRPEGLSAKYPILCGCKGPQFLTHSIQLGVPLLLRGNVVREELGSMTQTRTVTLLGFRIRFIYIKANCFTD